MKFDVHKLADLLKQQCPEICFALLHGSAKDGQVKQAGDIDLALFIEGKPTLELYEKVSRCAEAVAPGVKCDTGILNNAEPVYRFEALKGRLLFFRNQEQYLHFFSLTCREYESQVADYQRQQRYRLTNI
ncbi:MAG: nucleotidyltransferase domain-containing protein [Sedimentisphaerales bacterium]